MDIFWIIFFVCMCISICLTYANHRTSSLKTPEQSRFQSNFLVVYTLAYFADWLKGPYVYALYESYGMNEHSIALLFIAGFAASGFCGPFVGTIADKYGRKKCSMAYFVIYIASACCKITPRFDILLLGRILGGIGTALLSTALESWMVAEHKRYKYSQSLLDDTFSKATLCNSAVAVLAGLMAQLSADTYGYLAPFMVAIGPLVFGLYFCWRDWKEDETTVTSTTCDGFQKGLVSMDRNLWILGITQSMFMGSMYTFVFLWTPALDYANTAVPYGLIFAIFMTMISIGSNIFQKVSSSLEKIPFFLFVSGAGTMLATILALGDQMRTFITFAYFEMLCGLMFPTFGSLRSIYIPDEYRTTIMNIYGIPLNTFVVIILLNKQNMSLQVAFGVCCGALVASAALWRYFTPNISHSERKKYAQTTMEEDDIDDYELESDVSDLESDNGVF